MKKLTYIVIILLALFVSFLIYKFGANNGAAKYQIKDDFNESQLIVDSCLKIMGFDSVKVLVYPLTVEIETGKTRIHGYIKVNPFEEHSYIIYLRKNMPLHKKIEIIAHEMIHMEQLESKKLVYLYKETYLWENVKYRYTDSPYENREYEKDAQSKSYGLSAKLKKIFIK